MLYMLQRLSDVVCRCWALHHLCSAPPHSLSGTSWLVTARVISYASALKTAGQWGILTFGYTALKWKCHWVEFFLSHPADSQTGCRGWVLSSAFIFNTLEMAKHVKPLKWGLNDPSKDLSVSLFGVTYAIHVHSRTICRIRTQEPVRQVQNTTYYLMHFHTETFSCSLTNLSFLKTQHGWHDHVHCIVF